MVQNNFKTAPFLTRLWNTIPCVLSQSPKTNCGHHNFSVASERMSWQSPKTVTCPRVDHWWCGEWKARAALCSGCTGSPLTCVRGSCSLSLGLSSSRSQLRTKEQTVFSSLCSGYGYWLFNLHEELQAMYKLVLLIDLCFRNGGDKTWTPGLRTASYNCGETGKEKEKRNDSICAVSFIWSIWSVTSSYQ